LLLFISHRYRRNGLAQWCREKLKKNGAIASVSFGWTKNNFKHRDSKETVSQNLSTAAFGDEDETKLTGSTSTSPLRITSRSYFPNNWNTIDFFFFE
jgi:hypothetical protein